MAATSAPESVRSEDQCRKIPGHHGGEQDVDASQQAIPATLPAVQSERDCEDLDRQQSAQRSRGVLKREAYYGIRFVYSLHQESNRRHEIQHLQVRVLKEELIHKGLFEYSL